jgi:anti-anti-sigma factor
MGIDHTEGVLTVDLLPEPEMGTELETVANILRDGADCDVVVDFSNVDIVTSSSISKLLRLRKLLGDCRRELVLCGAAPATEGIFKVAGLDAVFEFTPDKSSALASIRHVQPVKN